MEGPASPFARASQIPPIEAGRISPGDPGFPDDDPRIAYNRIWFNLLRIHRSTFPRIARALRAEGIEDPVWHEIAIEIERSGAAGLQMPELERRLYVTQYALSRHVTRMVAAGWRFLPSTSCSTRSSMLSTMPCARRK